MHQFAIDLDVIRFQDIEDLEAVLVDPVMLKCKADSCLAQFVGFFLGFLDVFRGFLFDAVERRWSGKVALVVTTLAFAFAHGFVYALPILVLAVILGLFRMKTGHLRICILLHALNNTLATVGEYFFGGQ